MNRYAFSALAAGALWGCIGLFTRSLNALGFDTWSLVALRCGIAALCFALLALLRDPKLLRVRLRDLWCFLGAGILSLLFFTYCYFNAIALMELSTASILLYTAPVFVMVMSRALFGDRIGVKGAVALALCFAGVVLVSGVGGDISFTGFIYGICAGIGYALFSIFSRCALNRGYHSITINFYACAVAAVGALCFTGPALPARLLFSSGAALLLCLGLGVLDCFLPYLLYTYALTGLPNGRASIMATVEPVMATLLSVFLYGETLTPLALCGIVLVLGAIVLMNIKDGA